MLIVKVNSDVKNDFITKLLVLLKIYIAQIKITDIFRKNCWFSFFVIFHWKIHYKCQFFKFFQKLVEMA
mgnify:CR=1 FL=1